MIQNEAEFADVLHRLREDYQNNAAFFADHQLPEEAVLEDLDLTTDERALFLTMSIVPYHVDSETGQIKPTVGRSGLWRVCAALWEQHPMAFALEDLIEEGRKSDLARLFGKLRIMDSYDANWWYHTAETLVEEFDGDPQVLLAAGDHIAPRIEHIVKQHDFPGLADDVSTPFWLRLMHDHVTPLTDIEHINLALDHRIIDVMNRLGGTEFDPESPEDRKFLRNYWRIFSQKHDFAPLELDKPLRLLSLHWKADGADYITDILSTLRTTNS